MSQALYTTTPGYSFPQIRAALRSPAQFLHSVGSYEPEIFHGFSEAKANISGHAQAVADIAQCLAHDVIHTGEINDIKIKTLIDGECESFILRRVVTNKERPRGDAATFAFLIQDWHLDLQCALDLHLCGDIAYEWIVSEGAAPYEVFLYNPTAALIASGKEKLARAIANIKLAQSGAKKTGRDTIDLTPFRAKELGININE